MGIFKDLTGKRFGKLTVIGLHSKNNGRPKWVCKCDCGNETVVNGNNLSSGDTKSCGCLKLQRQIEANIRHGMHGTRIYRIWLKMKERCCNPRNNRYKYYGAKGIRVCDKWQNFEGFYEDMGPTYREGLTIDRKDLNKGYYKENCRWSTSIEQANNKSINHLVAFNGETDTMANMARKYNLSFSTLKHRLQRGWDVGKALTTPQRNIKRS